MIPRRISVSVSAHAFAQRPGGVGPRRGRALPASSSRRCSASSASVSDHAARIRARTWSRSRSGSRSVTLRSLWRWQRCTSACSPKTSLIARRSALPPSMTNRIACSGSRPRSTRSASSVRASVAFSVEPSQSPSGILTPSVVIPSATTCVRSAISRPSSIITANRTSSSRRRHQLPQRGAGALDEHLRHRRLRRRRGRPLDLAADRLADHARTCGSRRRRASGPSPPWSAGRGRRSTRSVSTGSSCSSSARAHPRAADRHAPAAQRHRSVLVAVALRRPGRGRACPSGPRPRSTSSFHQLVHDTEPDTDAQRQQALPRRPDKLAERLLDPRRQRTLRSPPRP